MAVLGEPPPCPGGVLELGEVVAACPPIDASVLAFELLPPALLLVPPPLLGTAVRRLERN
jgi:hypothetical protein